MYKNISDVFLSIKVISILDIKEVDGTVSIQERSYSISQLHIMSHILATTFEYLS
jgi:hypothetical protein